MEFSEDIAAVQGILSSLHRELGDYSLITKISGDDAKIERVIEGLRNYMTNKRYLDKNKINLKFELEIRRFHFFLILNTKWDNDVRYFKNSRFAHLINIIPPLSKWLLTKLVWKLNLLHFHAEVIYSVPVEVSLELLDYCNDCIKHDEPYAVLEKAAIFATAIYAKTYYLRNDSIPKDQVSGYVTALLQKFIDILNNYITPETVQMEEWPPSEIYMYMGVAILESLKLVKCVFNIFLHNCVSPINPLYVLKPDQEFTANKHLSKSVQAMKNLNDCLMKVCEANLEAVTLEVFCAWVEFQHNNAQMQRSIGYLADELIKELHNFENSGKLGLLLKGIAIKKQSIEELVESADEETLLNNVVIKDQNQPIWISKLLKHGILNSEKVFQAFKTVIDTCDAEQFVYLFNYYSDDAKTRPELRDLLLKHVADFSDSNILKIANAYFSNNKFNNVYELPDFEVKMQEYFNKLIDDMNKETLRKEAVLLLLQNPTKFMKFLFHESIRNIDHMSNILEILKFIRPITLIPTEDNGDAILEHLILINIKECEYNEKNEVCITELIKNLLLLEILSKNFLEELLLIYETCVDNNNYKKATLLAKICRNLPTNILQNYDCIDIILRLVTVLGKTRWSFFAYSEDKSTLIMETVQLLKMYKDYMREGFQNEDTLDKALQSLQNKIDCYHAVMKYTPPNDNFLSYAIPGYDKNGSHNEQVSRLMKVLPTCIQEEWNLIISHLLEDKDPIEILKLATDTFLILSEIAKKSLESQPCMLYCFQQYCVVINELIYPPIKSSKENQKIFINCMCKLIKRLPTDMQNAAAISLVNLFDLEVMKSMKDDEEFVCNLLSISHLEICKIIYEKIS